MSQRLKFNFLQPKRIELTRRERNVKALVYQGPWTMPVEESPEPEPVEGEVKIRVKYCGICGSDIHGLQEPRAGKSRP